MKKRAIRNTLVALSLAASTAAALPAEAAVPTTLTHQGRLYDQSNTPVVGSIDVLFAIYDSPNASVPLWSEQQTLTFDAGYYSAALGSVVPFPAGLFTGGQLYFGVTFGTDPEMTPRSLMGSVPFALVAGDVTGDIHPTTISISGVGTVIDAAGNWVGSPTGLQGPMGPMGPAGANGLDGAQGPMGPAGPMGPMGPAGANGLDGAQGPMGPAGPMGPTGPAGANGANGAQGPMGPAGPMGPMGPAGANGLDGAQGPMGPAGATGAAGPAGAAGATGATGATGSVNAASFLTLTPQSVAPANPTAGTVYFNSTDNTLRYFTGSAWQTLGNSSAGGGPEHALPAGLSSSDILNHLTLDSTVADTGLNAAGTSLVGSLSWIPGAFGTAGSGFSVSNAVALTKLSFSSYTATGLTFTAWVKGTDTHATASDYQVANNIFGDTTGSVWLGAGVASGKAAIRGGSTEVQSSLSVADGNWHHIGFVLTYSGGAWNVVIYVDGVASGSGALTAGGNPNYAINTIGRTYTGYTQYFGYAIDSVYLFNKSISAAQMSSLAAP